MGSFDDLPIFYKNITHNSIMISGSLVDITNDEMKFTGYKTQLDFSKNNSDEYSKKLNHMSFENNYNLAVFLKNVILDENANTDLTKHNWTLN